MQIFGCGDEKRNFVSFQGQKTYLTFSLIEKDMISFFFCQVV